MAVARKQQTQATKTQTQLASKPLARHLEQVFLGGLVKSCALVCNGGKVFTTAVNEDNALFLAIKSDINMDAFGTIAFGNLGIITKFLELVPESPGDITLSMDQNKLVVKSPTGPALKYLLASADHIASYDPSHTDAISSLVAENKFKVPFPKEAVEGFVQMMGLLKPKGGTLKVINGGLSIIGGHETEHQFTVSLGPAPKEFSPAFELPFYAEHLQAVLTATKDKDVFMQLGPRRPLIISVTGEDSWWALLPVKE